MNNLLIVLAIFCLSPINAAFANSDFSGTGDIYDMAIELDRDSKATAFVTVRRSNEAAENLEFVAEMLGTEEKIAFEETSKPGIYTANLNKEQIVESMILITLEDGDTEIIELNDLKPDAKSTDSQSAKKASSSSVPPIAYLLIGIVVGAAATCFIRRRKGVVAKKLVVGTEASFEKPGGKTPGVVSGIMLCVLLGTMNSIDAFAGAGHSHADDDHGESGFGVGEVIVPKKAQFILGVKTMEVTKKDPGIISKKIGVLIPRQEDVIKIKAPLAGVFNKVKNVRIGTRVKSGQILGYVIGTARVKITSPIDGILANMHGVEGERVDSDHELIRVVSTEKLWAEVNLFQSDLGIIEVGSKVNVEVNGFGTFPSVVIDQLFEINSETSTAKVLLEIDNDERKLPFGAAATAYFPISKKSSGLAVPRRALMNLSGSSVVFVKTDAETFVHRVVKASKSVADDNIIIEEGLNEGDIVVIEGNYQLLTASN